MNSAIPLGGESMISLVALLVLAGVVLGGLVLVALLLANKKTRVFGMVLVGTGCLGTLVLIAFFLSSYQYEANFDRAVAQREAQEAKIAAEIAEAQSRAALAFDELTEPQIKLEEVAEAGSVSETTRSSDEAIEVRQVNDVRVATEGGEVVISNRKTGEEMRLSLEAKASELNAAIAKLQSRPGWLDSLPSRSSGLYAAVIESGPYATLEECYQDTNRKLVTVVATYLNENGLPVSPETSSSELVQSLNVTTSQLRELLYSDDYVETIETSVADMRKVSTLVEITPADGKWLVASWRANQQQAMRTERVAWVSLLAGGGIGLLALAYGLLKMDEMTKGYYSKRLFLGVPAAIIAVFLLALFVA